MLSPAACRRSADPLEQRELTLAVRGLLGHGRGGKPGERRPEQIDRRGAPGVELGADVGAHRSGTAPAVASPAGDGEVLRRAPSPAGTREQVLDGEVLSPPLLPAPHAPWTVAEDDFVEHFIIVA
jgi:hypothetical protein